MSDAVKPAAADVRAALDVKPDEPLGYRRVRLKCGDHVLSEADNWYVPARLTPEMNHVLETTDTPFGKAVAALHFRRHTLSADLLWRPLPNGWEMGAPTPSENAGALTIPDHVLEHRAVLSTPDGEPFSEVVETYTGAVLDFSRRLYRHDQMFYKLLESLSIPSPAIRGLRPRRLGREADVADPAADVALGGFRSHPERGRLTATTSRHYDQTASQYPVDLSNPTPGFG